MRAAFPIVAVLLLAHLACSRAEGRPATDSRPVSVDAKAPTVPANSKGGAASKPPVDGALPQIEPLTEGKRVRIQLAGCPLLEVTAPSDMRLKMEGESDETIPHAVLKGRDGAVAVGTADYDMGSLAEYLDAHQKSTDVVHTQKLVRGFLAITRAKLASSPEGFQYDAMVWRPDLDVVCGPDNFPRVTTRAAIDKIASICLSIREVVSKK